MWDMKTHILCFNTRAKSPWLSHSLHLLTTVWFGVSLLCWGPCCSFPLPHFLPPVLKPSASHWDQAHLCKVQTWPSSLCKLLQTPQGPQKEFWTLLCDTLISPGSTSGSPFSLVPVHSSYSPWQLDSSYRGNISEHIQGSQLPGSLASPVHMLAHLTLPAILGGKNKLIFILHFKTSSEE